MNYAIATTAEPAKEPITLSEAKRHIRYPLDDEDANIERIYIPAARRRVESETGRALITQTKTLTLDDFPGGSCPIWIPCAPLQSVDSIVYAANDGTQTTLSTDDYVVDTNSEPGRILPKFGNPWPATKERTLSSTVLVTFDAGYGSTTSSVPAGIREAMLLLIGHYFYHREDVVLGLNANLLPRAVAI